MNVRNSDKDVLVGYNNFVLNHIHVIVYIKNQLDRCLHALAIQFDILYLYCYMYLTINE